MAKKTTPASTKPQRPMLLVPRDEAERKIQAQIDKGNDLLNRRIQTASELEMANEEFSCWGDFNYELLKALFNVHDYARDYYRSGIEMAGPMSLHEEIGSHRRCVGGDITKLRSLLKRLEIFPEDPGITHSITVSETRHVTPSNKVFVVHGHDEGLTEKVARFLEKLGLEAVILHEQTNRGQTIIEKLERHADVAFAVVLLTPDDVGGCKADFDKNGLDALNGRARQNVVFELGFFMAKLGRGSVAALLVGDVELQSDIQGVLYTTLDQAGAWKSALAKEMRDSGMDVYLNKA